MNNKFAAVLIAAAAAGCTAHTETSTPPQLWSDHKILYVPLEACTAKAGSTLTALNFAAVASANNSAYGNFKSNRAAVKCVKIAEGSLVYVSVAGPDAKEVEALRNKISHQL